MLSFSSTRPAVSLSAAALVVLSTMSAGARPAIDYEQWQEYRESVQHPAGAIKPADLQRARENVERYEWARNYADSVAGSADGIARQFTPQYLEHMIGRLTPACTGPCPACRAKGLPWHPNGQWSWSAQKPDELLCTVCRTVFPDDEFPESVVLPSKWDPEQSFGFAGGEHFMCFGYRARPSFTGIIAGRKLGHVSGQVNTLALAYALKGDPAHARAVRAMLLRLAEVFPRYMVRAGYGYGEIADMDPHTAAESINALPEDELVYPPNEPDRRLHTGFWSASRIGTSGMDGGWVSRMATAYDLTCDAQEAGVPVYSEPDRERIERDVLLESAYLAACDESINNKSVGNRAGAATVGMVVGCPDLVHFGLEGFERTVEEWFLPDGGTSESPAYAMMTMGGIQDFALLFRDYTDPEGFAAADGRRLEGFNAARQTRYGDCWQSLLWTLQGDLRFAPSADSYRTTSIGAGFAELIAVAYPTDEHLAFLKETLGGNLSGGALQSAIFYREPGIEARPLPPFSLPDIVFPFLAQGYLRTGETGRDSLLLLNASDWGGHHHYDSLDLYYWKDGRELLSDLGYLWDHPDSGMTRRTFSHNTALVEWAGQKTRDRGGSLHLFTATPRVKAVEASSAAYDKAEVYRRTCVQVDHGAAGAYVLDIFRVQGGASRQYVFHGPSNDYEIEGLESGPRVSEAPPIRFAVRFHLPRLGEVFVDDVEIREVLADGELGPNLAPNPSASGAEPGGPVPGWGYYSGNGRGEWSAASPGRTDDSCARVKGLQTDDKGVLNIALLVGDSAGYEGTRAMEGRPGARYRLSFWLRGGGEQVSVGSVCWPTDPASADDRLHAGILQAKAGTEWERFEGSFALGRQALDLENPRVANPDGPWRIVWHLRNAAGERDGYRFAATVPAGPDEEVILGDGWGQRDHRNSDRGATLPYVVRHDANAGRLSRFVTVFAGTDREALPVKAVRMLPLPPEAPADAVAVEVQTALGVDVLVSMSAPTSLTLQTSAGEVTTDGRLAAVLGGGQGPTAATLVGGTLLRARAAEVTLAQAVYTGRIVANASEAGSSYFTLEGELPVGEALVGRTLLVRDGDLHRAYPVRGVEQTGGQTRIYTKVDNVGFEARPAESWELLPDASWERG
jgi:hypothetical protein